MSAGNLLLKKWHTYLLLLVLNLSIVLSISYQQNRFFSLDRPLGMNDARSYISMSKGNYNVSDVHSRRFLIPELVRLSRPLLIPLSNSFAAADEQASHEEAINEISYIFSFWIINSTIMAIAGLFLYLFLESSKITPIYSLLGSIFFLSSRTSTYTAGAPLVDSIYYLGISIFCYTLIKRSAIAYALSSIFLAAFTKENAILIPFAPLISRKYRSFLYYFTAFLSTFTWILIYNLRGGLIAGTAGEGGSTSSLISIVKSLFPLLLTHFSNIFTLSGFYNLFHGYGALMLFAIIGAFYNYKRRIISIALPIVCLIPLSLFFAVLSGNLGRMFFGAFVPIIVYALIGIYAVLPKSEYSNIRS